MQTARAMLRTRVREERPAAQAMEDLTADLAVLAKSVAAQPSHRQTPTARLQRPPTWDQAAARAAVRPLEGPAAVHLP